MIRVSIQAGDTSGFTSAIDAVKKDIASVSAQNQAAMQSAINNLTKQQSSSGQSSTLPSDTDLASLFGIEMAPAGSSMSDPFGFKSKTKKRNSASESPQPTAAIQADKEREEAHKKWLKDQKQQQSAQDEITKQKWAEYQKEKSDRESSAKDLAKRKQDVMDNDVKNAVADTNRGKNAEPRKRQEEANQQQATAAAEAAANTNAAAMALWGFGAAIKLWTITTKEAEETANRLRQHDMADASSSATKQIADRQNEVDYHQRRAGAETNQVSRVLADRKSELRLEEQNREIQSRDDLSPEHKRDIRGRLASTFAANQQRGALGDDIAVINSKQEELQKAKDAAKKKLATVREQKASEWAKGNGTVGQAMAEHGAYEGAKNALGYATGGFSNVVDQAMGGVGTRSKQQNTNVENLQLDAMRERARLNKEELQTKQEIQSIEAQNVQLQKQKLQKTEQIYKVTRAEKLKAEEDVFTHKEAMRQNAANFGMSSFGAQARARMVDQKLSRIKAQREAGHETERLLPHEADIARGAGIGRVELERQGVENFNKNPLQNLDVNEEQLREKEAHHRKIDNAQVEERTVGNIEGDMTGLKDAIANSMKAIEGIKEVATMVIKFEKTLSDAIEQIKTAQQQRAQMVQPWFGAK